MLRARLAAGNGGQILAPYFFPPKETVDSSSYARMKNDCALPQVDAYFGGRDKWVLQRDGATAHGSKVTTKFLADKKVRTLGSGKIFWPPTSAFLNPLDYYFNGRLKAALYNGDYDTSNLDAAKAAAIQLIGKWNGDPAMKDEIARACKQFQQRLEECARKEGAPVKKLPRKKNDA